MIIDKPDYTSNVNTTGIDENFPIPGQNNSSEGFRRNFLLIKSKIQQCALELSELREYVLPKLEEGNIFDKDNDVQNFKLYRAQLIATSHTFKDLGFIDDVVPVSFLQGNFQKFTMTKSCELSLSSFPIFQAVGKVTLWITVNNVAHKLILPNEMLYGVNATYVIDRKINFPAPGNYLIEIISVNNAEQFWLVSLHGLDNSTGGGGVSSTIPVASPSVLGAVKIDGTTIGIQNGVISVIGTPGGIYAVGATGATGITFNLATKSTTDLAEGTNLYYTDSRFDARLATKSTTNLAEGTNLYYTDSRFDSRLATKNTTDLAEGGTINRYWTPTREQNFKNYVDTNDYLNLPPLAGVLKENLVPLYSDFKFSLGANASFCFFLTDDQNFDVVYFHANTPVGLRRPFRAYRFSPNDTFIFDAEPLTVNFTSSTEYISALCNIGSQFAYLNIRDTGTNTDKLIIVKTKGSSKSSSWSFVADVTSIAVAAHNFFLMVDSGGDRLLRITMTSTSVILAVFNTNKTLLRSQQLFTNNEVLNIDQTTAGRTGVDDSLPFGYNPFGLANAFTWNKFTENLLIKLVGWFTYSITGGGSAGNGFGTTLSWIVPKQWLLDGTGPVPTNLIPLKSTGFRYHKFSDSTWDTPDGGMGNAYGSAGQGPSVHTDEFGNRINIGIVGTWTTTGFDIYSLSNVQHKTLMAAATYSAFVPIPDASPWSKNVYSHFGHIIGNNILFSAVSNTHGGKSVSVNFSTSNFSSAGGGSNNTLVLDPSSYVFVSDNPNNITTTVILGVGNYFHTAIGNELKTISVISNVRTLTGTGFTIPVLPTTISGITNLAVDGPIVYNGNDSDRKFWAVVRGNSSSQTGQYFIAKYTSGSWSAIYGPFYQTQIDGGKSNRGDTVNSWYTGQGNSILTENGRFISVFGIPYVGGSGFFIGEFDTVTNSATAHGCTKFDLTASPYGGVGCYGGLSFGYSSTFGYYLAGGIGSSTAIGIISSKDIKGINPVITEDQWFNATGTRHNMVLSAESAVGLFVYTKTYPIFLGGYYGTIGENTIAVPPNTTSYIYATKPLALSDRSNVTVTASTILSPSGFRQVRLGTVVTDANKVISATPQAINESLFDTGTSGDIYEYKVKGTRSSGNNASFTIVDLIGLAGNGTIEITVSHHHSGGGRHGGYARKVFATNGYLVLDELASEIKAFDSTTAPAAGHQPFVFSRPVSNTLRIVWDGTHCTFDSNFSFYLRVYSSYSLSIQKVGLD